MRQRCVPRSGGSGCSRHTWLLSFGEYDVFCSRPLHPVALVCVVPGEAAAGCEAPRGCLSPQGPLGSAPHQTCSARCGPRGVRMHLWLGPGCRGQGGGWLVARHACVQGSEWAAYASGPLLAAPGDGRVLLVVSSGGSVHAGGRCSDQEAQGQAVRCHAGGLAGGPAAEHSGACSDRRRGRTLTAALGAWLLACLPQAAVLCVRLGGAFPSGIRQQRALSDMRPERLLGVAARAQLGRGEQDGAWGASRSVPACAAGGCGGLCGGHLRERS